MLFRHAVGAVLRAARVSQGRSLREVASVAGMSIGYLSEVERGHKEASSELLSAAASALGMPVSAVVSQAAEQMVAADSAVAVLTIPSQEQRQRPVSAA
ncbi:MAG: helix-turn-helix transcriptional regulator [Actinomycetales bacterium]|nr:helix-turn-helix transcriptional regulator [Actinomycetales bacterium]